MARVETTLKEIEMQVYTPDEKHAPSYLPKDKKWKLVWQDEFDGDSLDESKWNYRLNYWGVPSPTFTKEGVSVKDSKLTIALVRKGDDFYSAHLQTELQSQLTSSLMMNLQFSRLMMNYRFRLGHLIQF